MPVNMLGVKTIQTIASCCTPITGSALTAPEARRLAAVFKLLGDPTRLRLLSLLAAAPDEVCVCDLPERLGVKQPTVSHHLKALHEVGLVTREQRGKWAYYHLDRTALAELSGALAP